MKKALAPVLLSLVLLCGCADALQRGMLDEAYISTARPSITVAVPAMPLMASGQATANLFWTGMMGGLNVEMWIAVYGEGGLAPLAIVAQAQTPQGWHWDGMMRQPFSVDEGIEIYDGVEYQACTFIVNPASDPFGYLVTGVQTDGQPQLWLTRSFQARYNFNVDKMIYEYREPLPEGVTDLSALPFGQAALLADFAQRARSAFNVSAGPKNPQGVKDGYIQGLQMKYMGQKFLGTASPDAIINTID